MENQNPVIKINPTRVLIILLVIIAALVGLSARGQYLKYNARAIDMRGAFSEFMVDLVTHFYIGASENPPTYVNLTMLFLGALLLGVVFAWKRAASDKFKIHWLVLACTFLFLSVDKLASLHQNFLKPIRATTNAENFGEYLYFAIFGGAAILYLLAYLPLILNLENKFKILFLASLGLYIGGVLGSEALRAHFIATEGLQNYNYGFYVSFVGAIELIGEATLVYSLLAYIKDYLPEGFTLTA